jgi:acetylglutamate kinase
MPEKEFSALIADAYEKLPLWIRQKTKNVALLAEDTPDDETVRDMNLEDRMELLGLYRGVPLTERTVQAGFELPDSIVLYRLPILEESDMSGKPVADVVFETLWHEIAHHFGLNEDDVMHRETEEFGG